MRSSAVGEAAQSVAAPALGSLAPDAERGDAESLIAELAAGLAPAQAAVIRFGYDHRDQTRGLMRAFVSNHWQATPPPVRGDFFTPSQQALVHAIFRALLSADGYERAMRQLHDDCLGHPWGADQSVALLGDPREGPYQFVFSGRHVTLRADGGSDAVVAFGGPVFYAHAPGYYVERPDHPGNVYWHEAVAAWRWLEARPRELASRAIVDALPPEPALGFRASIPGLKLADVDAAALAEADRLLDLMLSRFRAADRTRVRRLLDAQGGLRALSIQFARDGRMSAPRYDNWRLEGPSFVWHWRGFPHVHAWVHIAASPDVPLDAVSGQRLFAGQDPLAQPWFPFRL